MVLSVSALHGVYNSLNDGDRDFETVSICAAMWVKFSNQKFLGLF